MQIQEILTTAFHVVSITYGMLLACKFAMGLRALRPVPVTINTHAIAHPSIADTMPQSDNYAQALTSTPPTTAITVEIAPAAGSTTTAETTPAVGGLADPWDEPEPTVRRSPRWTWMGSINAFDSFPPISAPSEGKSTILRLASSKTVLKPKKVELQDLTSRQLKKLASEAKVANYSKMRKSELIAALSA